MMRKLILMPSVPLAMATFGLGVWSYVPNRSSNSGRGYTWLVHYSESIWSPEPYFEDFTRTDYSPRFSMMLHVERGRVIWESHVRNGKSVNAFSCNVPHVFDCYHNRVTGHVLPSPTSMMFYTPVWHFSLHVWWVFLVLITYPTIAFIRGVRQWRRRTKGWCIPCGYDLTGNESGVCPECGNRFETRTSQTNGGQ